MRLLISALSLAGCVSLAPLAHAQESFTRTTYWYQYPGGEDSEILLLDSRTDPLRAALAWSDGPYSVLSRSSAALGMLDASASASSWTSGNIGHFINSGFGDQLTLSHPDLSGQPGQVTMSFHFQNRLAVSATGETYVQAGADWTAFANDATGFMMESLLINDEFSGRMRYAHVMDAGGTRDWQPEPDERQITLTADFVWGEPFWFGYSLATEGQAVGTSSYEVETEGYWGGVLGVTAGGAVIDDYSIASRSGIDYSVPFIPAVPEPAPLALLAAGLFLLGGRQARRTRPPTAATTPPG